jgi:hypothetical protein
MVGTRTCSGKAFALLAAVLMLSAAPAHASDTPGLDGVQGEAEPRAGSPYLPSGSLPPCFCANASLCAPLILPPRREVFAFMVGTTGYHWAAHPRGTYLARAGELWHMHARRGVVLCVRAAPGHLCHLLMWGNCGAIVGPLWAGGHGQLARVPLGRPDHHRRLRGHVTGTGSTQRVQARQHGCEHAVRMGKLRARPRHSSRLPPPPSRVYLVGYTGSV